MVAWTRDELWRQGQLLPTQKAVELKLIKEADAEQYAVVIISHDCDVAADVALEPTIEVIIGRFVDELHGNVTNAKNVRELQIKYDSQSDKIVELKAANRICVDKQKLTGCNPRDDLNLALNNKRILQKWLAARYDRSAFPNEFEHRLKKHKTHDAIAKILKPSGEFIRGVYFDLGNQADTDIESCDDVYELEIYLLHVTEPDTLVAEDAAKEIKLKISACFSKNYCNSQGQWTSIELIDCHVISDEAMTVRQSLSLRQWRMDHMSLREDPNQPMAS